MFIRNHAPNRHNLPTQTQRRCVVVIGGEKYEVDEASRVRSWAQLSTSFDHEKGDLKEMQNGKNVQNTQERKTRAKTFRLLDTWDWVEWKLVECIKLHVFQRTLSMLKYVATSCCYVIQTSYLHFEQYSFVGAMNSCLELWNDSLRDKCHRCRSSTPSWASGVKIAWFRPWCLA